MYNPNTNSFEMHPSIQDLLEEKERSPHKQHWRIFSVGDTYELNGVKFKVHNVTKELLILKPCKSTQ